MRNPRERLAELRRERRLHYDRIDTLNDTIREFEAFVEPKKFIPVPRYPNRNHPYHNTGVPDAIRRIFSERNEGISLYVKDIMAMIWDVPSLTEKKHKANLQNLRNQMSRLGKAGEIQRTGRGGLWKV